ncbi:hypothetical protein DH2020_002622 [Rehmannia glutinosa]|uniref:DUF4219 domain-containing protein n=1 Tax=Rehmannia glutinosa TaxID=99300 RepID=A0ABR0XUR5_REHGL
MVGSSSKFTLETLSGQAYPIWSRKIKGQLISEGLWHLVEKGYKKPKQGEMLNDSDMHLLKQNKMNDTTALSLIHKSLSPNIFMMIIDATTAKEAWDNLHTIFRDSKKMKEVVPKDGAIANTVRNSEIVRLKIASKKKKEKKIIEMYESGDKLSTTKAAKISDKSDIREDDGVMPLSGDKPFFDMCLTKSAVRPLCHMLVCEHNLLEGDFLVFEIMEMDDSKLEVNLQVLRNIIPPELEEEIRKRATKSKAKAIYIDDGNKE